MLRLRLIVILIGLVWLVQMAGAWVCGAELGVARGSRADRCGKVAAVGGERSGVARSGVVVQPRQRPARSYIRTQVRLPQRYVTLNGRAAAAAARAIRPRRAIAPVRQRSWAQFAPRAQGYGGAGVGAGAVGGAGVAAGGLAAGGGLAGGGTVFISGIHVLFTSIDESLVGELEPQIGMLGQVDP